MWYNELASSSNLKPSAVKEHKKSNISQAASSFMQYKTTANKKCAEPTHRQQQQDVLKIINLNTHVLSQHTGNSNMTYKKLITSARMQQAYMQQRSEQDHSRTIAY
jgi:hypothetical protein